MFWILDSSSADASSSSDGSAGVEYSAKAFLTQCAYWNESGEVWDASDILVCYDYYNSMHP